MVVECTHKFLAWKCSVGNFVSQKIVSVRTLPSQEQQEHGLEIKKIKYILYNGGYNVDWVKFDPEHEIWSAELFTKEFYCVAFLMYFLNTNSYQLLTVKYITPGKMLAEFKRLTGEETHENGTQIGTIKLKFSKKLEEKNRKKIKDRMQEKKKGIQEILGKLLNGRS